MAQLLFTVHVKVLLKTVVILSSNVHTQLFNCVLHYCFTVLKDKHATFCITIRPKLDLNVLCYSGSLGVHAGKKRQCNVFSDWTSGFLKTRYKVI